MSITFWLYEHTDHLTIGREQSKPRSQFVRYLFAPICGNRYKT